MPRVRVITPPAVRDTLAAAAHGEFSGAVVALLPSEADAARLTLEGFEPAESLHVTLAWLGDTDGDPAPAVGFDDAVEQITAALASSTPGQAIEADVFSIATFNPSSDERDPATVLLVQGDALVDLRGLMVETVGDASSFPVWFPHLTLGYATDTDTPELDTDATAARMGPVVFDRVRVAYGSEQTVEIPLGMEGEQMTASTKPHRRVRVTNGSRTVTASTTCTPCTQGFADDELPAPVEVGNVDDVTPGATWSGVLAVEGIPTGDGRMFEGGSMRWDNLPVPLRWVRQDEGEHRGAVVVGRILEVWRDGAEIRARGDFDVGSAEGREAARQVSEKLTRGVSVDVDDVDIEIRLAGDVLDEMEQPAMVEGEDSDDPEADPKPDADGRVTVIEVKSDDELTVFTDARIRAATIVATPAFVEAMLQIDDEAPDGPAVTDDDEPDELVASSRPKAPPAAWFKDPELPAPTPVTITEDGRIFGHVAAWGTCHTAYAHECVTPPASASSYAYFRTGAVRADEGTTIPTGRITLDTTHAGRRLGAADTVAHYEHTGRGGADVAAGEDAHGIWIAGAVRPGLSDDEIRTLAASPLSGDWRRIGGALELVHVLAVNSPGFPIPRALVAGGAVQTLQASGVLDRTLAPEVGTDDARLLARVIERERQEEDARRAAAQDARSRVLLASAVAKVRQRR